jgi:DNA-binding transcriptional regulator LsrR (DeoR family)
MSILSKVSANDNDRRETERDLTLMAHVARKYYIGGMSKSEIASELYLSRFKVARLIDSARDEGVVQFTIGLPGNLNANLSRELEDAFRLRRAVVIDDPDHDQAALFGRLGEATVELLAELIEEGDYVGIASTRTMMGLQEPPVNIARCTFVQLTGELPRSDAADVISGIRALTRKASGAAQVFYAPMVASSDEARASYMVQPEIRAAFELFPRLDVFVTGIGAWAPGMSLIYDNLPNDVRIEASKAGAVAEMVGVPIDRNGKTVPGAARRRVVAPDVETLLGTRDRIAVVFDPVKAPAVKIAVNAGVVNTLVTHRSQAEALLAL